MRDDWRLTLYNATVREMERAHLSDQRMEAIEAAQAVARAAREALVTAQRTLAKAEARLTDLGWAC